MSKTADAVLDAPMPPTKEQLENNIRMADKWRKAVRRGQYAGDDATPVAQLLAFLDAEHDKSLAEYEAQAAQHAEWGRPADLMPKPVAHS